MRRVLVDHARARNCAKRGKGLRVSFAEAQNACGALAAEIVALNDALEGLMTFDARKAKVVELRFFGGLSVEETAEVLGVSPNTVVRDWTAAKAWLHREISKDASTGATT
jgi:RNA polymerase sigma factor (TIGR02999 family)